ncbi:unnamed protein product [Paramecium primaurelia]|uniref:Uncharacterized protein n=1 Tax=Paramecium primaurelia TaxID=5886 RepID=A0A8S1MG62_PARPR|nr:unnamed protein product [Paramecium primaurelia]
MRVVSETKYYKVLAKLYEKCASLSAQLDIYEFDSPKAEQFEQSENSDDNIIKRTQNKRKQKYIPNTIIKLEEEQQKQQYQYLSKNKKTISQNNNGKSTKIKKKIKKPKNYDFSSSSSQTSSSYN